MAGQSIFFRTFSLLHNSGKIVFTNRIHNVIPASVGLKQDAKEYEKYKIPEKPKRPLTAYFMFLTEKRPILAKQNPALSAQELVKNLSEEWKSLSNEAKLKYEEEAQQKKGAYEKKIVEYEASLTPEQVKILKKIEQDKLDDKKRRRLRKELKDEGKPKRPPSAFGLFLQAYLKEKSKHERQNLPDVMPDIKAQWTEMKDAEKDKYKLEYNKRKAQYEKELANWEAKMITEGKDQLVRAKTLRQMPLLTKSAKKSPKSE